MNQNNKDHHLSVFEIDANDDETDVVFLEHAYAYHQQLVAEENRLSYSEPNQSLRPDATGRVSLSVIMKYTAVIRQLAYGTTPDAFDEYLQMTLIVCTENGMTVLFHGKDNTVGEIKKYPTIMLEAIASQDLWIWHAFFGITAPVVPYVVNGVGYEKGYYLADGARKDVERAFGVLQGRWGIIKQPARSYHVNILR
nr:hypothetical protein [Tanacetum cinerariifolium]